MQAYGVFFLINQRKKYPMKTAFIKIEDYIDPAEIKSEIEPWLKTASHLARKILLLVMQFRRIAGPKKSCATTVCEACLAPHLRQVIAAIKEQQAITFVLPAFPAKSPNLAKV